MIAAFKAGGADIARGYTLPSKGTVLDQAGGWLTEEPGRLQAHLAVPGSLNEAGPLLLHPFGTPLVIARQRAPTLLLHSEANPAARGQQVPRVKARTTPRSALDPRVSLVAENPS